MKTQILITSLIALLFTACIHFESRRERYGFDCDFHNNGSGLVLASIEYPTEKLHLNGEISVNTGALEVYLKAPGGDTIYNMTFGSSKSAFIDTSFNAQHGIWSLSYKSFEGEGQINLHIEKYDF